MSSKRTFALPRASRTRPPFTITPRRATYAEAGKQEPQRIPVGRPDERGALRVGLIDQANDRGVGALLGGGRGPELERTTGVERAAADRYPSAPLDGEGLTGQSGLIDDRGPLGDHAIGGQDLPWEDGEQVTDRDLGQPDVMQATSCAPVNYLGRSLDQGRQAAAGSPIGGSLEGPAAGQHHGHHSAGQQLAHYEGAGQGQAGQDVHPQSALTHRLNGPPQREHQPTDDRGAPDHVSRDRDAQEVQ